MNLIEKLSNLWTNITGSTSMTVATVVAIIVFSVVYFLLINFSVNNNSSEIVSIFVCAIIIGAGLLILNDKLSNLLFLIIPSLFLLAVVTLYSVELKRVIWARRRIKLTTVKHGNGTFDEEKVNFCINELIKALQNMSKSDTGAIIVLSSGNIPSQIIDSGVRLDSDISSELVESVFFPKTPLHDGAMIIDDTKIVAAGCFLPLTQNVDNIPKDLGTRHRAGIGVTEALDVVSIIVSEESGIISIAKGGKITRYADTEILKKILTRYYWQELEGGER